MCWLAFIVIHCGCFYDVICVPTSVMGCVVCCNIWCLLPACLDILVSVLKGRVVWFVMPFSEV
jgi:hypothetical protein